ncbi:hypothetical protein [Pelosinus sp. IPA-1]|uniref:hypothetical protein n=1 Tax=Pelosinus sp. IPA-1 TaxID=3029569 RepID=UPI0024362879|nr:hypothetical protein [Pelosinus sp. IPA-1]GMB01696.1 hypothetical protein PIPA1_44960 [Pelosinus sp. IPA-1]
MYNYLQEEVFKLLDRHTASYAKPLNSKEIGEILKVTPSYIRSQLSQLVKVRRVGVRRGNGGGYYVMQEGRHKMQGTKKIESEKQFEELGGLLSDMENYLYKVAQGSQELSVTLHGVDRLQSLEMLTRIMEGLDCYQKLLKSAAVLLTIDFSEPLYEETTVLLLFDQLCQVFTSIVEATESEDYSLLADLIEYDLVPVIRISQGMLGVVQERYKERAI